MLPVLVGQPSPHDFPLRVEGEDDHAHVAASGRDFRASLPVATWPIDRAEKNEERKRYGIRTINGEALRPPCRAEMRGSQIEAARIPAHSSQAKAAPGDRGPCEEVDPITAAVAVASSKGVGVWTEEVPDPSGHLGYPGMPQHLSRHDLARIEEAYNKQKSKDLTAPNERYAISQAIRQPDGKVIAVVKESLNAARRRWQNELSAKSFHSAIFDSPDNHRQVTAYDVAIGSGKASTHPEFYAYLCAVADWRLKKPEKKTDKPREGILTWGKFMMQFDTYFACEPEWRKQLIEGNVHYYTTGELQACLPLLTGKLWDIVISETTTGERVNQPPSKGKP